MFLKDRIIVGLVPEMAEDVTFGIELEGIYDNYPHLGNPDHVYSPKWTPEAFEQATGEKYRWGDGYDENAWTQKYEETVDIEGGYEYASPILHSQVGLARVQRVLDHLHDAGFNGASSACGLQVQVGFNRELSVKETRSLMQNFSRNKATVETLVMPHRRHRSTDGWRRPYPSLWQQLTQPNQSFVDMHKFDFRKHADFNMSNLWDDQSKLAPEFQKRTIEWRMREAEDYHLALGYIQMAVNFTSAAIKGPVDLAAYMERASKIGRYRLDDSQPNTARPCLPLPVPGAAAAGRFGHP